MDLVEKTVKLYEIVLSWKDSDIITDNFDENNIENFDFGATGNAENNYLNYGYFKIENDCQPVECYPKYLRITTNMGSTDYAQCIFYIYLTDNSIAERDSAGLTSNDPSLAGSKLEYTAPPDVGIERIKVVPYKFRTTAAANKRFKLEYAYTQSNIDEDISNISGNSWTVINDSNYGVNWEDASGNGTQHFVIMKPDYPNYGSYGNADVVCLAGPEEDVGAASWEIDLSTHTAGNTGCFINFESEVECTSAPVEVINAGTNNMKKLICGQSCDNNSECQQFNLTKNDECVLLKGCTRGNVAQGDGVKGVGYAKVIDWEENYCSIADCNKDNAFFIGLMESAGPQEFVDFLEDYGKCDGILYNNEFRAYAISSGATGIELVSNPCCVRTDEIIQGFGIFGITGGSENTCSNPPEEVQNYCSTGATGDAEMANLFLKASCCSYCDPNPHGCDITDHCAENYYATMSDPSISSQLEAIEALRSLGDAEPGITGGCDGILYNNSFRELVGLTGDASPCCSSNDKVIESITGETGWSCKDLYTNVAKFDINHCLNGSPLRAPCCSVCDAYEVEYDACHAGGGLLTYQGGTGYCQDSPCIPNHNYDTESCNNLTYYKPSEECPASGETGITNWCNSLEDFCSEPLANHPKSPTRNCNSVHSSGGLPAQTVCCNLGGGSTWWETTEHSTTPPALPCCSTCVTDVGIVVKTSDGTEQGKYSECDGVGFTGYSINNVPELGCIPKDNVYFYCDEEGCLADDIIKFDLKSCGCKYCPLPLSQQCSDVGGEYSKSPQGDYLGASGPSAANYFQDVSIEECNDKCAQYQNQNASKISSGGCTNWEAITIARFSDFEDLSTGYYCSESTPVLGVTGNVGATELEACKAACRLDEGCEAITWYGEDSNWPNQCFLNYTTDCNLKANTSGWSSTVYKKQSAVKTLAGCKQKCVENTECVGFQLWNNTSRDPNDGDYCTLNNGECALGTNTSWDNYDYNSCRRWKWEPNGQDKGLGKCTLVTDGSGVIDAPGWCGRDAANCQEAGYPGNYNDPQDINSCYGCACKNGGDCSGLVCAAGPGGECTNEYCCDSPC